MISYHKGNLLESGCDIICHQVNLQGFMGGGLAKQIADKYPNCKEEYKNLVKIFDMKGDVHFFAYMERGFHKYIANCFSQELNFDTNYNWLKQCFSKVLSFAKQFNVVTIGVPKNYGCGIANGDWIKVEQIFKDLFENDEHVELQIWELQEDRDEE